MAEKGKKSKEEIEKEKAEEFKKMQDLQMKVLSTNSGILGSNYAKSNGGSLGSNAAEAYMNYGEGMKMKQDLYNTLIQEYKKQGIAWDPVFPDNGTLVHNSMNIVYSGMPLLTLGNLEEIVNKVAPGKDFKVEGAFKNMTGDQVQKMLEKVGNNIEKLSEKEKDAVITYNHLQNAYIKGSAMTLMLQNYLSQENAIGKAISEKYKPKEDKKEDKGKKK